MRPRIRRLVGPLAVLLFLGPLATVQLIPTDTTEPYVFRARIAAYLGESSNSQILYFRADTLDDAAPAQALVIALDRSYSRGMNPSHVVPGFEAWFQGGPMTPDIFYGEQYLFFGLPQIYVRQVKSGLLWPDQWSELRVLYLSPAETLAAPVQIPFLLRSDGVTLRVIAVMLARCALIAATAVTIFRRRLRGSMLLAALLCYALAAMLLTVPILGDLY